MSEHPFIPGSSGNVYTDTSGNELPLHRMVRQEPEWACSRIREGEKAAARVQELEAFKASLPRGPGGDCYSYEELADEYGKLVLAIRWALGESPEGAPDFPDRKPGQGAYYWRTMLRELSGIQYTPPEDSSDG